MAWKVFTFKTILENIVEEEKHYELEKAALLVLKMDRPNLLILLEQSS